MGAKLSFPTADLSGKVALITGGNAGIGYETAKAIAAMGAHTIIACRSAEKAAAAIEQMKGEITAQFPDKTDLKIESMSLDLGSFKSTKDFTVAFKEKQLPLHILINNAGIIGTSQTTKTDDGFEIMYQVNHLSHFLMTIELLPVILDTAASCGDCRIIILSSSAHQSGVFEPDNMNCEKGPHGTMSASSYGRSKLYNVMHGFALQRRLKDVGVTVSVVHPGFVNSNLFNELKSSSVVWKALGVFSKPIMKNTATGAATSINCAVNPELKTQQCHYYVDTKVALSVPLSRDEVKQEQLWGISSEAVKQWMSPELYDKYGSSMPVEQGRSLEENPPATEGTTPATEETTPATEETTPATEGTTPATEETTPATEGTTPATEETTPATEETTPATEETTPATEETTPATEETTPATEETTPATEETTPATEETTPATEEK